MVTGSPASTTATVAPAPAQSAPTGTNRRPSSAPNHTTTATRDTGDPCSGDAVYPAPPTAIPADAHATTPSSATHHPRATRPSARHRPTPPAQLAAPIPPG
ncbi:hypothetical protein [Kitasatospora sp. NPDC088134]|uniref:hypothetical protein n=1 Tax=Kitasatospora sp. NPDC088134 TaxID=3364071 RepID=UPI003809F02A